MTTVDATVPNSVVTFLGRSSNMENDSTFSLSATGHGQNCSNNIPVNNSAGVEVECDRSVGLMPENALGLDDESSSVPNKSDGIVYGREVIRTAGTTAMGDGKTSDMMENIVGFDDANSGIGCYLIRRNDAAGNDTEDVSASATEDEARPTSESAEMDTEASFGDTNKSTPLSTAVSAVESGVVPQGEGKVHCVRCGKARPLQHCPVCKRLFASLPHHIGIHSGNNPYAIASLLRTRTTYVDDENVESGSTGVGGGVEASNGVGTSERVGMAVGPQARRRKRRRVPQQCTVCGGTYTKLTEHMARMHGDGGNLPRMCTDCGKFLRSANSLRAHMLSKTCQKSRVCPICDRTCENDAGLKSHLRSHASSTIGEGTTAEGLKEHRCDQCGHAFSSSQALDSHLAIHAAGNHHVCCICGRTFIHARSLRVHLRLHTGKLIHLQCYFNAIARPLGNASGQH